MEASELKIGNLIYKCYPEGNEVVEVKNISENFVNSLDISSIKPIPLTDEWLFKLGFKKVYETCYQYKDFEINDKFIMMDIDITVQLKYVHSLQNLYFALTGEELTIKE